MEEGYLLKYVTKMAWTLTFYSAPESSYYFILLQSIDHTERTLTNQQDFFSISN